MSSPTTNNAISSIIDDDICMPFPQRLMEILSNEDNLHIINWLPHGKGFVIYKKKEFARSIMPLYFRHTSKWTSFTRKLNRWGFDRVSSGPEMGAYYHKFFQRDEPRLCHQMFCEAKPVRKITAAVPKKETFTCVDVPNQTQQKETLDMSPESIAQFNQQLRVLLKQQSELTQQLYRQFRENNQTHARQPNRPQHKAVNRATAA
mmetsp:Transcript_31208/g.47806  ORF Transcript_31208/g.47806 Transcript_31208/m.47806 type:complete len:204 (-) Transcript_31208:65-676(-)